MSKSNGHDKTPPVAETPKPENHTFLNIPMVAKKSKTEVDAYLGEPIRHETISPSNAPCPCESYLYKDGNIEIVFMSDKADWITVNNMNSIDYTPAAILQALGIQFGEPIIQRDNVMKWNDFGGYDQISVFGDGKGKAMYAFIKTITH